MIHKLKFNGVNNTTPFLVHTLTCRTDYAKLELKSREGHFCIITFPKLNAEEELDRLRQELSFVDVVFEDGFKVENLNLSNLDPAHLNPAKVDDNYCDWRLIDIT